MAEPRFDHGVSEDRIEYECEYRDAEYEYEPTAGGGKWGHPANPPSKRLIVEPLEADFRSIESGGLGLSPQTIGFPFLAVQSWVSSFAPPGIASTGEEAP